MSTRDVAFNIVNLMDEEQLRSFVSLFQGIVSDIPNEETVAAMEEAEDMSATDIARLIEWLRAHGHTDAEIVECLEYITKK